MFLDRSHGNYQTEVTGQIWKRSAACISGGNSFRVSAVKSKMMKLSDIKCDLKDIKE